MSSDHRSKKKLNNQDQKMALPDSQILEMSCEVNVTTRQISTDVP